MTTLYKVNRKLKELNIPITMYKGKGYYYFMSSENIGFYPDSLYTTSLQNCDIKDIIDPIVAQYAEYLKYFF